MADKIKVAGYAQRVFYNNGIEYRNFSDNLVGQQLTSPDAVFTSGNFSVTINQDPKLSKNYITKEFSSFYSLADLKVNDVTSDVIKTAFGEAVLNLNKANLNYYAYFGSLVEFIRVSLENIITNWPASLYITSFNFDSIETGPTISNFNYDILTNTSTFDVDTERITNKFKLNYEVNGTIIDTYNETNDLRNLTVNHANYVVSINGENYEILDFIGSEPNINNKITIKVKGKPIDSVSSEVSYHIRPNDIVVNRFFASLPNFEGYLLNTFSTPRYKASFEYFTETDTGVKLKTTTEVIWPVSDGYNIDFDTEDYITYVQRLISIGEQSDITKSDLINRFLVSTSISDFDTIPNCEGEIEETAGQKMNKTLRIYGREFDEIKKHIDNIAFANVVTYNKQDNTPDIYLKNIARVLGWELVSSVLDNDLLNDYLKPKDSSYVGMSRGYTPYEAEVELWRRLILNSPWVWKSKGTRKSIDFFLKFIGTPDGLMTFNEYVYKAKNPIDVGRFKNILAELNDGDTSLDNLNVDSQGYPIVYEDNPQMYFQDAGLWYRRTTGENSNIDVLTGNNPHTGNYDGGQAYIDQFRNLIPNFTPVMLTNEFVSTSKTNIFRNYNGGIINGSLDDTVYINSVNKDNISLDDCYDVDSKIIEDPKPRVETTDCNEPLVDNKGDDIIKIEIKKKPYIDNTPSSPNDCGYIGFTLDPNGYVIFNNVDDTTTTTISKECCEALGFTYKTTGDNSCYWKLNQPQGGNIYSAPPTQDRRISNNSLNNGLLGGTKL